MTLQHATIHRRFGQWPRQQAAGTLTLEFQERHRRRLQLTTDQGEDVLLELAQAVAMAHGDGLQLGDGRWLEVRAAPEPVVEIGHSDLHQLTRLAWHLGNRHLPTEIGHGILRIRPDHVIEAMLVGLGAQLVRRRAAFQPEGGAYGDADQDHHPHEELHSHA